MFLSHRVWKLLFHTTTKRQTGYSRFAIPISTIPVTKHPLFLKISLSLFPNALLSPPQFSAPPLPDLSSWSHGSLSPEGFSSIEVWSLKFERFGIWKCWFEIWFGFSIEVWRLKDLGFESVDLRSDLGLKIWVLFGFGNNKILMFEVGV